MIHYFLLRKHSDCGVRRTVGGGGLALAMINKRIAEPIVAKFNQLQNAIEITSKDASSSPATVNDMLTFKWSSDDANNPIPRFLPENYEVPRTIHPLSIWQQWHHGASFNEGKAVGPLEISSHPLVRRNTIANSFC
jgi:hypothetical protein